MADETPRAAQQKYSTEEMAEIYETAAKIESETLFTDDTDSLTPDQLAAGAKRAGISDKALQAAIAAEAREDAQEEQARHDTVQKRALLRRNLLLGGGAFAGVFVLCWLTAQTKLSAANAQVETQRAQVENVLQRRHDLVPNLIAVTKATLDNQRELVAALDRANRVANAAQGAAAKQAAEGELGSAMNRTATALQTGAGNSPAALRLIDEMAGSENRIAQERRRYNQVAASYNSAARRFPASFFRPLLRYPASYPLFQADSGARDVPRF